jgi:hypothetical protein
MVWAHCMPCPDDSAAGRPIVRRPHERTERTGRGTGIRRRGGVERLVRALAVRQLANRRDHLVGSTPAVNRVPASVKETILRARGVDTVLIGGIATNFCCDTTAREAHAREFKVLFLSDVTCAIQRAAPYQPIRSNG